MNQEKIAKLIKKIRKDNNLTQKELANKLNVTFQAVSKWETGKSTPDVDTLKRISDLYNIDINDLLSGVSTKKKRKWFYLVIVLLLIIVFGFLYFHKNTFEFKTITTTCDDFEVTGSIAYNHKKASLYISEIEYCGKETDKTVYEKIECNLYNNHNGNKTLISTCKTGKNTTLEQYLKEVNIILDDINDVCKDHNEMELELKTNNEGVNRVYNLPLELNTCSSGEK